MRIDIKDLWKKYSDKEVLKGLTLSIKEGETLVILGRSGVGKSVLLRQIIGIETPDKGSIFLNGVDLHSMSSKEKASVTMSMGMLFQGAALFDSMNIFENTAFYIRQHEPKVKEKEVKERVIAALDMVGLKGSEFSMPSELSGGMRKRAALARVIIYRPRVILYDEPTTGLDPITSMHINELINATQKELKATSVVVTHDIRSAFEVGDRLALHHEGKIFFIGTKEEFLKSKDPLIVPFLQNAEIRLT